jgi:gluconolactonase
VNFAKLGIVSREYVVNMYGKEVRAYPLERPGVAGKGYDFCELAMGPNPWILKDGTIASGGDGLAIDESGNLYITSSLGIQVFTSEGRPLGIIKLPEKPSNCIIGGPNMDTLFVTAKTSLYSLRLKVKGPLLPVRKHGVKMPRRHASQVER